MKEKISLQEVMDSSPNLILWAAPVMIGLALLEMYLSFKRDQDRYETKDFLASLSIGLIQVAESIVTKSIVFLLVLWVYNIVPWSIPMHWSTSILCFVLLDLCRYWAHRVGHETNLFWATHVTHHNSEKYNLSTSFRLSWTQQIKVIFFLPISLMGFHPVVFFICHQIAVLYQFWIHTESIRKLPPIIEFIFTTPSHHRVHHGRNDKYLDKNYGSTLIIWDRIFGTFQPEEEQADYGVVNPPNSYNPITLNFHVWQDIVANMRQSGSIKEAVQVLFNPPDSLKELNKKKDKNSFN